MDGTHKNYRTDQEYCSPQFVDLDVNHGLFNLASFGYSYP